MLGTPRVPLRVHPAVAAVGAGRDQPAWMALAATRWRASDLGGSSGGRSGVGGSEGAATILLLNQRTPPPLPSVRGINDRLSADTASWKVCTSEVLGEVARQGRRHWLSTARNARLVQVLATVVRRN